MNRYKKYNLSLGWLAFLISSVVYLMTMEPTASLWDCSEFIATSYKLEVGHPPGAPLFMMISRLFAIFAPSTASVALMVNTMSSLASGFTILFLFWTITHLARKFFNKSEEELTLGETWAVMGAGLIGALAYTFTDTFWFSAVEGEVYALSSLFTAVVFWAMLKWENVSDEPGANRWLILIAYLMGLSIGVHLLNLLAFPAMVFIYYFKKYSTITKKGVFAAIGISAAIIIYVLYIIVPGTVILGATADRMFVNTFGLPVNAGFAIYAFALFALMVFLVYYTHKKGKVILNTIALMTTVILLGYSSYASVVIRSSVNPPMNSNAPKNGYGLYSLLNRDQYGDRPLVKGGYYNSPGIGYEYQTAYYENEQGKYVKKITSPRKITDPEFEFIFPRMHSDKEGHVKAYQNWANIKGRPVKYGNETIVVPTFGENLRFFFAYQLNFMYWRYFLWNFVGRQSDEQSQGSIASGNWLSGIDAIDELYLGPQTNLPEELANNKGRNKYYFLPFLLGVIGLVYQLGRDKKGFTVVMWMFFMTGIAIILYLNQGPAEPRERDYAFAGSFYSFAIWIGLGVLWMFDLARKFINKAPVAAIAATAVCAIVPAILVAENWDDHDRSHRYTARDIGHNYLESVLPNAIIMNYGDNDTFPLWYSQEVEGTRPDVRIMNMSYLSADWYIDQMRYRYNESAPVPFSLPRDKYMGNNEFSIVNDVTGKPEDIKDVMEFFKSNSPVTQQDIYGKKYDIIPAKTIKIPVNKQNAIASGIVTEKDAHLIEDTIVMTIKKGMIDRGEIMLIDLLSNFDWKRPLHFTSPSGLTSLGLADYLQYDGFTYRLVPIKTPYKSFIDAGRIDSDYMYENLMKKFKFANVKDPRVHADVFVQQMFNSTSSRGQFGQLAKQLAAEGKRGKAIEVLNYAIQEMPFSQIKHSYINTFPIIEGYYAAGDSTVANKIALDYANNLKQYITYYMGFPSNKRDLVFSELSEKVTLLSYLYEIIDAYGQREVAAEIESFFEKMRIAL